MNRVPPGNIWLDNYRVSAVLVRRHAFLAVLTLLLIAGASGWVLYSWYVASIYYGPAAVWNWTRLPLLTTALLIPVFFYFLVRWNNLSRILVRTHSRGLLIIRGRKQVKIPWNAVAELYTEAKRYGFSSLVWKHRNRIRLVTGHSGKQIKIPGDLENLDHLVHEIKSRIYPELGSAIDQRLFSGQTVSFGPIQISSQSLQTERTSLNWENLKSVELENGTLKITFTTPKRIREIRIQTARIPNLDLCYQLIRRMSGIS